MGRKRKTALVTTGLTKQRRKSRRRKKRNLLVQRQSHIKVAQVNKSIMMNTIIMTMMNTITMTNIMTTFQSQLKNPSLDIKTYHLLPFLNPRSTNPNLNQHQSTPNPNPVLMKTMDMHQNLKQVLPKLGQNHMIQGLNHMIPGLNLMIPSLNHTSQDTKSLLLQKSRLPPNLTNLITTLPAQLKGCKILRKVIQRGTDCHLFQTLGKGLTCSPHQRLTAGK